MISGKTISFTLTDRELVTTCGTHGTSEGYFCTYASEERTIILNLSARPRKKLTPGVA